MYVTTRCNTFKIKVYEGTEKYTIIYFASISSME